MKKVINEVRRMQVLAGLITESQLLKEEFGFDDFMDSVSDFYDEGTPEYDELLDAVSDAFNRGKLEPKPYEPSSYNQQIKSIDKEIHPKNYQTAEGFDKPISKLEKIIQQAWAEKDLDKAKQIVINFISDSKIKSKDQIINTVKEQKSKGRFDQYLANSLLKFEKLGL